jgi:hypothetical protein
MRAYQFIPFLVIGLAACTKSPQELCEKKKSLAPDSKQSVDDCAFGLKMMQNLDKSKYESFAKCVDAAGDRAAYDACVDKHPGKLSDLTK